MRDSSMAKGFSDKKLDRLLDKAGLHFHTKPRQAQKVCTLLGWKYPSYMFSLEMGGGKSKVALDLFANRHLNREAGRALVLVRNVINLWSWEDQVKAHTPHLTAQSLDMTGEKGRWATLTGEADVVMVTYAGLAGLLSNKVETDVKGKIKIEWRLSHKKINRLCQHFNFLICDESTEFRTHSSIYFKMVKYLSKQMRYTYALTGTPFGKNVQHLWSQFYVLDQGYTLGETLGLFRGAYFDETKNYWGGYEYKLKRGSEAKLNQRIRNRSIRYEAHECQDMPEAIGGLSDRNFMIRYVPMPAEITPYYDAVRTEVQDAKRNLQLTQNVYHRARMLTAGWLGAYNDLGERCELEFPKNPKLDGLLDLLAEIPEDEKVIVFHWYNVSGSIISKRLTKEKIKHVWIYGKTPTTQVKAAKEQFLGSGGPRVLLASGSIAMGANLQTASRYMAFFESPVDPLERRQVEARILRGEGLKGPRYFYDLAMIGTVDVKNLYQIRAGASLADRIVDGKDLV